MKYLKISILLFILTLLAGAQCVEINPDTFQLLNGNTCAEIDHVNEVCIEGEYEAIQIYKNDSLWKEIGKNALNGFSEAEILSGYCFCEVCIANKMCFGLDTASTYQIRISEGKQVQLTTYKVEIPQSWDAKSYKSGDRIQLNDILFIPGEARFQRSSYVDLNKLLKLLERQKELKIEIQGHVNGPNKRNNSNFQSLSEKRAEAVLKYLVSKGIDPNRLQSKGYGNTQMIYPTTTNDYEMRFNRRVEIVVL